MEGVLHKWTNYMSGWQPRWFVLEGGTLSYYDSQEDVWKGCKGSIRVCVCEIQVHPTDLTRMDLTVPGEQHFYLKALNAAERQKWLVALGTAKACLTDNRTKWEKELQENTKALKTKMSELRLYCDLLLQQVGKIQDSSPSEEPDATMEQEDGALGKPLLKSTCSTFLKTLEECMLIASQTFSKPESLLHSPTGLTPVAAVRPHKVKPHSRTSHSFHERREFSRKSGSGPTCEKLETDHPDHCSEPPVEESQTLPESSSAHLQIAAAGSVGMEPEEAGDRCGTEPAGTMVETEEVGSNSAEAHGNATTSHQKDDPPAVSDPWPEGEETPGENERHKEACRSNGPRAAQLTAAVGQDRGQEQQR